MSLAGDARDVEAACASTRAFALARGADEAEASTAAEVIRALLDWVARACFPAPATGRVDIALAAASDGIRMTVRDDGVPLPSFGSGMGPIPEALEWASSVTVDLHMINGGNAGKTLVCIVPTARELGEASEGADSGAAPSPDDMQIRLARPEDAEGVGRVIHSVWGLRYVHPQFYDADALRAEWTSGAVISAVAVAKGEVVGHAALMREQHGNVYEIGVAVMDPRFRGLGMGAPAMQLLMEAAMTTDAHAILAEMVTTHTRSQSGPARMGFVATGLLIGAGPSTTAGGPRQTVLIAYLPLRHPSRAIALPSDPTYRHALTTLYGRLNVELVEQNPDQAILECGGAPGIVHHESRGEEWPAVIVIRSWGSHERELLIEALRDAVVSRPSMIYVDCDLHTLTTGQLDEIREFLSFYDFMGAGLMIFGEYAHDYMRLQAMLTRELQIDEIMLLTDEAKAIRAAIFNDHAVLAQRVAQTDE